MNERLYALTTWGGTIIVNQPNESVIGQCIHDLAHTEAEAVIILTNKVNHYWATFREHFTLVEAGGGVVSNKHNEILAIFRRGFWDLPKGKKDEDEDLAECALREVIEETGLKQVELGDRICTTYHTYYEKGKNILKASHWWHMYTHADQKLKPQAEEDILEARWVAPNDLDFVYANTFPGVKDVLKKALKQ